MRITVPAGSMLFAIDLNRPTHDNLAPAIAAAAVGLVPSLLHVCPAESSTWRFSLRLRQRHF